MVLGSVTWCRCLTPASQPRRRQRIRQRLVLASELRHSREQNGSKTVRLNPALGTCSPVHEFQFRSRARLVAEWIPRVSFLATVSLSLDFSGQFGEIVRLTMLLRRSHPTDY